MSNPLIEQILDGRAPERLRIAAARGALPLPPAQLAKLYLHLRNDEDGSIQADARQSLEAIGDETRSQILEDPECAPEVLIHFAAGAATVPELAERIAFHDAVSEPALAVLAGKGNSKVIDLVLTNQEMLLAHTGLLDRLMANPALRPDQRGKILDVLERIAAASESDATSDEAATGEEDDAFAEAAALLEVDVGELLSASEIIDGHEFAESEEEEVRSAYQKILRLNTAQKAIMAMKGNREERQILIRDTNKTVSLGVLKNPRLTDGEVEGIAKMRNVSEDVLRWVGANRDWSKSMAVVLALVYNPRTPQTISTNFITRINNKDLQKLQGSRDVPELVRRMARRTLQTRRQAQQASFKKK